MSSATDRVGAWPRGDAGMATSIRALDWSGTAIGAIERWSVELRAAVDFMLASPMIHTLAVGPMRVFLYNDAAAALYGERHPRVLGLPLADAFPEEFSLVAPFYDRAFAGESVHVPAQSLDPAQGGSPEIFSAYLIPIRDAGGDIGAVSVLNFACGAKLRADAALAQRADVAVADLVAAQSDILRLQQEAAAGRLRESEERYRTLFDSIDQGFCVVEVEFGEGGETRDCRFLEANAAFAAQTGLGDPIGKQLRELVPAPAQHWFDTVGRIAATGRPERFERHAAALGRWYDVYAFPVGELRERRVGVLFSDISSRKRHDAALIDSHRRFQVLATSGNQSVFRVSADWRVMYALNSETLAISADPIADWTGKCIAPEDREGVEAAIREASRTRSLFDREYRLLRGDGSVRWVRCRAVPMLDADGTITEWFGTGTDVTAARQGAERLRQSEERLRQFGEASRDILWIRDADTLQWVYLTRAFETVYGLTRDQALTGDSYRNWHDLILHEDRAQAMACIARVRNGEHVTYEFRIRRPSDGTVRWLRNTDFPIADETGRVVLIGGIGHDFTEVRETALRFQTLVEGIPQLVWRAIDGGEWTWASPQWLDYTGQTQADCRGWGWIEPLHPDDHASARAAWSRAMEQGGFEVEYRVRRQGDGAYRWFQTRAVPVRDDGGTIIEWLGTSTDIHDLRRLQDRQTMLLAELQHRVRNILTVVRSVFGRTVEAGSDMDTMADHFRGRLDSLARMQLVVTQSATGAVDLDMLIRDELLSVGAGDGPNIIIEGPDVDLSPKAAESIGLAIHELTTNALKYGALKVAGARLEIRWSINMHDSAARWLDLSWTEQGVPVVSLQPRRGFGSELINEALPYRLGAETRLQIRGGGVRCTISVPLSGEDASVAPAWKEPR